MKLTPHQKIMRAFKRHTGVRLSREDVDVLGFDDAIATVARLDDEEDEKAKNNRPES